MGYEKLIASMVDETEAERKRILEKASQEATRILEAAEDEVESLRQGPLKEAERRLSGERMRRLHDARLKVESRLGEAKKEIMERVIKRAEEMVEDMISGRGRASCLKPLLAEAVEGMDGGTVYVRPEDRKLVEGIVSGLGGSFKVAAEEKMSSGLRFVSRDGLVEVDNTLPTRLRRYLSTGGAEVANLLFEG